MELRKALLEGNKRIAVWGTGHIGYSTMSHFAERGVQVLGFDIDQTKVDPINAGDIPIMAMDYWLGFDPAFLYQHGMAHATSDFREVLAPDMAVHFIAIPTERNGIPWMVPQTAIRLSTDYVFDGATGYYREDEKPQPTLHYGQTKWEAEQSVERELPAASLPGSSILRTSLMYGWPVPGGHGNLATGVINRLENNRPFCGYTDMYRSPTYVGDVVEAIVRLIPGKHPGTHHLAGPEWVHMGDFARAVAEVFRLNPRLVEPAEFEETHDSKGYNASRPRLLGLDPTQTAKRLKMRLSGMISGLEQMQYKRRGNPWQRKY